MVTACTDVSRQDFSVANAPSSYALIKVGVPILFASGLQRQSYRVLGFLSVWGPSKLLKHCLGGPLQQPWCALFLHHVRPPTCNVKQHQSQTLTTAASSKAWVSLWKHRAASGTAVVGEAVAGEPRILLPCHGLADQRIQEHLAALTHIIHGWENDALTWLYCPGMIRWMQAT